MRTDVAFAPLGSLLWTIIAAVDRAGGACRGGIVLLGDAVLASHHVAGAVSQVGRRRRSLAAAFPSTATTSWACSPTRPTTWPAQLRKLLQDLQQASIQITGASTQVLTAAEEHASGSVQQAASIAQVTATMEELTNTAKQIALSATSVEKIADDSAQAAHAGYDSVGEALEAMEKIRRRVADISGKTLLLGERSQRISEVLNLIKDIAGEIHLLAVNAAIESAAAGEHGKRFAVVASEVRRLAERTRESAEEIKGIVGEIQSATNTSVLATEQGVKEVENGVSLATRARGSLEQIIQMVDRTTQAIRQITFATQQQQSASEQIVQTMREVAEVTRAGGVGHEAVGEFGRRAQRARRPVQDPHQGIQAVGACHGSGSHPRRNRAAARRATRSRARNRNGSRISGSISAARCTGCRSSSCARSRGSAICGACPARPPGVAGLVNLRGEILCALDVRAILGLPAPGVDRDRRSSSRCADSPIRSASSSIRSPTSTRCRRAKSNRRRRPGRPSAPRASSARRACAAGLMGLLDLAAGDQSV